MRGETQRGDREGDREIASRSVRGETERGDSEGDRESVQECEGRDREGRLRGRQRERPGV